MQKISFKVTEILWHVNCKNLGYVFISIPDNHILENTISTAREHIFPQLDSEIEEINSTKTGYGTIILDNELPVDFLAAAFLDSHPEQTDLRPITHHLVWFPSDKYDLKSVQNLRANWIFPVLEHIKPVFDEVYTYSSLKEIREHIHEKISSVKINLPIQIEESETSEAINLGELNTKQETPITWQHHEPASNEELEKEELLDQVENLFKIFNRKLKQMPISSVPIDILRGVENFLNMIIKKIDGE